MRASATRRLLLTAAMSRDRPRAPARACRCAIRAILDTAVRARSYIEATVSALRASLFASTVIAEASPTTAADRAWLGEQPTKTPGARARHLALANPVSTRHRRAARAGRRAGQSRGAPTVAAELADLAVERSPVGGVERVDRTLQAAETSMPPGHFGAIRSQVTACCHLEEQPTLAPAPGLPRNVVFGHAERGERHPRSGPRRRERR